MFSQHWFGWFHTSRNTPVVLGQAAASNTLPSWIWNNISTKPGVLTCRATFPSRPALKHYTATVGPVIPLRSSTSAWHVLRPIASCAVCLPAAAPEPWRVNLESLANKRRGVFWSSLMSVAHQLIVLWTPKLGSFECFENTDTVFWVRLCCQASAAA